jgi:hypothetical protein
MTAPIAPLMPDSRILFLLKPLAPGEYHVLRIKDGRPKGDTSLGRRGHNAADTHVQWLRELHVKGLTAEDLRAQWKDLIDTPRSATRRGRHEGFAKVEFLDTPVNGTMMRRVRVTIGRAQRTLTLGTTDDAWVRARSNEILERVAAFGEAEAAKILLASWPQLTALVHGRSAHDEHTRQQLAVADQEYCRTPEDPDGDDNQDGEIVYIDPDDRIDPDRMQRVQAGRIHSRDLAEAAMEHIATEFGRPLAERIRNHMEGTVVRLDLKGPMSEEDQARVQATYQADLAVTDDPKTSDVYASTRKVLRERFLLDTCACDEADLAVRVGVWVPCQGESHHLELQDGNLISRHHSTDLMAGHPGQLLRSQSLCLRIAGALRAPDLPESRKIAVLHRLRHGWQIQWTYRQTVAKPAAPTATPVATNNSSPQSTPPGRLLTWLQGTVIATDEIPAPIVDERPYPTALVLGNGGPSLAATRQFDKRRELLTTAEQGNGVKREMLRSTYHVIIWIRHGHRIV